ncbi:hypothetical protein BDM02DRAFT_2712887 [Thelephora ganbajun]|uniref:Uncharacterized protein n=1 Tax=Thelephora ganbajun TaxID=370292 RepID=A0ACB6ZCI7_THEGA|nr:hypothetical protein BDM02DRAFT_2712887 [Thelephora ganbajun]
MPISGMHPAHPKRYWAVMYYCAIRPWGLRNFDESNKSTHRRDDFEFPTCPCPPPSMSSIGWSLVLRISSISIGIYEYILTLPAEWNFYFGYKRRTHRWDVGAILFALLRYVTIMAITFNNVGYFVEGFSVEQCEQYHIVSPVLKVIQVMISQSILGLRTYAIAGRNKRLGIFLLIFWIVCTTGGWFTGLYGRKFVQDKNMNCIAMNDPNKLYTWSFYLIAMVYDLTTFCISCYYLLYGLPWDLYKFSSFIRRLFVDGMQYFIALTAVNVLNLIVYRSKDRWIQSSAAPFGYLITWIMSQRILIHMRGE